MNKFALPTVLLLLPLSAAIPHLINLDGYLTDNNDNPLTGNYDFTFSIYDVSTGGTALWTETQEIPVSTGNFNALLGSVKELNLPFTRDYYLEVIINSETLSPRYRIASSPYTYTAERSKSILSSPTPPVPCDQDHEGYVFYNSSSGDFLGCSSNTWIVLGGSYGTQFNPGLSCKDILQKKPGAQSGVYWIKPAEISFRVYCDMTTEGGGWTLVLNAISGENTAMYDQNPNPFNGFQETYALNYNLAHDWCIDLSRFSASTVDILTKYDATNYVLVTNVNKADLQTYRKDGAVDYTMVAKNTYDNVEHNSTWWCGTSSGAWRICIGTGGEEPFYSLWHSDDCFYGQRIDGTYRPGCDESHQTFIRDSS